MDTDLHLKLLTLAISKLHSRSRSLIHRLGNVNHPFFYPKFPQGPPQNSPRHSIKCLLQVNKSHPQIFLLLNKLLLHLSYNKYCINCTSLTSETKLHIINIHLPSQPDYNHPLENFHNLVQQLYSPVGSTFQSITLSLEHRHQPTLPPISRNYSLLYYHIAQVCHPDHSSLTAADSISTPIPDGPTTFPAFNLPIAALTSLAVISAAGPLTACPVSRPSLSQSNSSFKSFSKCLHTSFNPSGSTTTFPSSSLI